MKTKNFQRHVTQKRQRTQIQSPWGGGAFRRRGAPTLPIFAKLTNKISTDFSSSDGSYKERREGAGRKPLVLDWGRMKW